MIYLSNFILINSWKNYESFSSQMRMLFIETRAIYVLNFLNAWSVPSYVVGETELEASREGRSLTDFKYACLGYSVYVDNKNSSSDQQNKQAELPFCVGLEVLYLYSSPLVFLIYETHFTLYFDVWD